MQVKEIHGQFADALVYTVDNPNVAIDEYAVAQIRQICDCPAMEGNRIRVMPDVHPGNGCVIGLTMTLVSDKVMPNLVGVDIGCGVSILRLERFSPEFPRLDRLIAEKVPSGFAIHERPVDCGELEDLCCLKHVQVDKARKSLGTLGGGNHFVEIACGGDGAHYLIIHTGSRHLGKEVCECYLRQGRRTDVPYELTWLAGDLREQYLHDMRVVQHFATANRERIARVILRGMKWEAVTAWECAHNYIDFSGSTPILRKGSISAALGERVIIPVNMRDGSIVGLGKGNPEWNWSAPHGSGRISTRTQTREQHTLTEFKKAMQGIHASCISKNTLDEAPFAYRTREDLAASLGDCVDITDILRPVYNFKAGSQK